MSVQFIWG